MILMIFTILILQWFIENNHPIYIDRVSQVPFCPSYCKGASTLRVVEYNGKKHSFSDQWGERMWLSEPERYECQNIFEQYEGRELSEVIAEGHGVRSGLLFEDYYFKYKKIKNILKIILISSSKQINQ